MRTKIKYNKEGNKIKIYKEQKSQTKQISKIVR